MLDRKKHVKYIESAMNTKDMMYLLTDQSRIFTVYWAANALNILEDDLLHQMKPLVIELVKSCLNEDGGFGGNSGYGSNILSTFHALQLLFIYNVSYVNSKTIDFIISLQDKDGGFMNDKYGEKDTRFDCCAVLSLRLLEIMQKNVGNKIDGEYFYPDTPFNRVDLSEPLGESFFSEVKFRKESFISHIQSCYNLDGGFGQIVGSESHAAQVFCCVSALRALGCLNEVDYEKIEDFLVFRQCSNGGFNGRIQKKEDVCYSFWAYSALLMLGSNGIDKIALRNYIFSCEGEEGGFSDRSENEPDLYHLMFSLASLSMIGEDGLKKIDPGFCL